MESQEVVIALKRHKMPSDCLRECASPHRRAFPPAVVLRGFYIEMEQRQQRRGEGGSRPLILVLHDIEEVRDGMESLLQATGFNVIPVRNESDAIQRCRSESPALLLVSLRGKLEEVTATAMRVRNTIRAGGGIPIVIFCVPTIPEGTEVALDDNIHFARPDNFQQLRTILRRLTLHQ